jgi:hypothetical protein
MVNTAQRERDHWILALLALVSLLEVGAVLAWLLL